MTEIAFTIEFRCRRCCKQRALGGPAIYEAASEGVCECDHVALLPRTSLADVLPNARYLLRAPNGNAMGGEEGEPLLDMAQAARLAYRIAVQLRLVIDVIDLTSGARVDRVGPFGRLEAPERPCVPQPLDL